MSRCWTCRRRRLKCDGGVPHCQKCLSNGEQCLGYTKPLTWVEGVARRGPMKNRSFGDEQALVKSSPSESPSPTLTEPLLQDLDDTSKFFVDYFSKGVCPIVIVQDHVGNRYREILPLLRSSPVVASAIAAVAACHYTHRLTGSPLAAPAHRAAPTTTVGLNLSRDALVERYLHSKAKCLRLLSESLKDEGPLGDESTFTAVVLLALLDLIESGSGSWTFHLEGAKKMIDARIKSGRATLEGGPGALLHEIILFQAFGSSLTRPGVLTSVSDSQLAPISSLSPIACPVEIVWAVEEFASQRRLEAANVDVLHHTLETMRQLDVSEWASRMARDASAPSQEDLVRLGNIWKLSAEIYACRILRNMTGDMALPPVEGLVQAFSFLNRKDDELIKCLIWPAFIAGASSVDAATREWALRALDRIWAVAHVGNVKNAALVLTSLWEKQDRMLSRHLQEGATNPPDWDWVGELSQLDDSWLFV